MHVKRKNYNNITKCEYNICESNLQQKIRQSLLIFKLFSITHCISQPHYSHDEIINIIDAKADVIRLPDICLLHYNDFIEKHVSLFKFLLNFSNRYPIPVVPVIPPANPTPAEPKEEVAPSSAPAPVGAAVGAAAGEEGDSDAAGEGEAGRAAAPANSKEKTPMCLVNELARYNKVCKQTHICATTLFFMYFRQF